MKFFLKHLEIHLSIAGIAVILLLPNLFNTDLWKVTAITAVLVGLIHGLIFWTVRNRQRKIRNQTVSTIQNILLDKINNNLQIINLGIDRLSDDKEEAKEAVKETKKAIANISLSLDTISDESLNYSEYDYK